MVSLDSNETRRRLLRTLPNVIIITVIAAIGWRYFVHPYLKRTFGEAAPTINARTLHGKPFVLAAERGHMVVLDFFATWCEPCRESLPYVERFAKENPDVSVEMVDQGETPQVVTRFAADRGLKNIILDEHLAIARAYNVTGFPTIVVVDDQGRLGRTFWGVTPQIGEYLRATKTRYDALRRARNAASPARPS